MTRDARRTPLSGPAFIRLLAALNDAPVAAAPHAFAERLSRWFDWTDAISLSAALNGPASATPAALGVAAATVADEKEAARVRAALARAIADASLTAPEAPARPVRRHEPRKPPAAEPADFAAWRERIVACQQAMETAVAPLRRRVRATLSAASPALAQLADLDAVLEQVVGEQEYVQLAGIVGRLEQRFDRLRRDESLPAFRRELRDVLLAELELRLQPVEGLLDALRSPPAERAGPESP